MKKLAAIVLLFLIILWSCKRERSEPNYYMSFAVDGVNETFTGHVVAHRDTSSGYFAIVILGAPSSNSIDNYMGVYLDNYPGNGIISNGSYEDNSANFTLLTTYANNGLEHEAGQSVADDAVFYNVTIANHFKINITSIDNNTVRGTFSGDYYQDGNVQNGTKLSITNGEFHVPFQ